MKSVRMANPETKKEKQVLIADWQARKDIEQNSDFTESYSKLKDPERKERSKKGILTTLFGAVVAVASVCCAIIFSGGLGLIPLSFLIGGAIGGGAVALGGAAYTQNQVNDVVETAERFSNGFEEHVKKKVEHETKAIQDVAAERGLEAAKANAAKESALEKASKLEAENKKLKIQLEEKKKESGEKEVKEEKKVTVASAAPTQQIVQRIAVPQYQQPAGFQQTVYPQQNMAIAGGFPAYPPQQPVEYVYVQPQTSPAPAAPAMPTAPKSAAKSSK